jgi:branched-chain amino acid aminotransferase
VVGREGLGIGASVIPTPRSMIEAADEIFLTTTAGGIMNVSNVNGSVLNGSVLNEGVSPVFSILKQNYWCQHGRGRYVTPVRYDEG